MSFATAPVIGDLSQAYWESSQDFAGHQQADAVLSDTDSITVVGRTTLTGGSEQAWLLRLDDAGAVQWSRDYSPVLGTGNAIAALHDTGYVVAGDVRHDELAYQGQLLRLDTDGGVRSSDMFGSPGVTGFSTVAVLADGSMQAGGAACGQGWLLRAASNGAESCELLIGHVDEVIAIAPLPDGGYATAALGDRSTSRLGVTSLAVHEYDGHSRWRIQLPTRGRAEPAALARRVDGSLVLVGNHSANEHASEKLWILCADPAGVVMWERMITSPTETIRARTLASTPDGSLIVAADEYCPGEGRAVRVIGLSSDGEPNWECRTGSGGEHRMVRGLTLTDDGGAVIVGSLITKGLRGSRPWVARIQPPGHLVWEYGPGLAPA